MSPPRAARRIVILGGGFGGLYTAYHLTARAPQRLRPPVLLINRDEEFVFKPLLPEVYSGATHPALATTNLPRLARTWGFRFVQAEVHEVDTAAQRVRTSGGEYSYGTLVIALGSHVADHGLDLDTAGVFRLHCLDDTTTLRDHVHAQVRRAVQADTAAARRAALRFAVVGAGPCGVQTVAALQEHVARRLRAAHAPDLERVARYTLLEAGDCILPALRPCLQAQVTAMLGRRHVSVETASPVVSLQPGRCRLRDGRTRRADTIVWVAGVRANPLVEGVGIPVDAQGRLPVDRYLRVRGLRNVYALGDNARAVHPGSGRPLPPMGQVAVQEAKAVARNILRSRTGRALKPFRYRDAGQFLPMGTGRAAGHLFGRDLGPTVSWLASRAVYVARTRGVDSQVGLVLGWSGNALTRLLNIGR